MDHRFDELERSVADLSRAIAQIGRRVAELEARIAVPAPPSALDEGGRDPAAAVSSDTDATTILSLVGRTCVVLGGGYLLRALTDGGTLPRALGTALGLAYAIAWFAAAWRADGTRRAANAAFHAIAATLIAFPLVWEAAVRVRLLSQASAAVVMAAVTTVGLAVAWHRRAQILAWIVSSGGMLTALALMTVAAAQGPLAPPADRSAASMTVYLAFLGVVTLWFAYRLDWTWLRWPPALVADLSVLVMTWNAADVWQRDHAGAVMLVQLALFAGYLVSFTARTLWRSRRVVPFEVVQTIALLVVCFGGAVYLMLTTGSNAAALGVVSILFGAGSYAAAFAFIDWRRGHWTNFVFYATLGVILAVAGTALVVRAPALGVVWSVLAVVTAWGGRRYGTITLSSHATIYAIAAAVASGLAAHATEALTASVATAWEPLLPAAGVALVGAALALAIPLSSVNESWGRWSRVPKAVVVVALLWCVGGTVCAAVVSLFAGEPGASTVDVAMVASIRTLILGGSVLLLAWAGRGVFPEGRWLSYVVLVAGALKLLVEDFPNGRPATLFLSLAVYGGALILGPRLRTRTGAGASGASRRIQRV